MRGLFSTEEERKAERAETLRSLKIMAVTIGALLCVAGMLYATYLVFGRTIVEAIFTITFLVMAVCLKMFHHAIMRWMRNW